MWGSPVRDPNVGLGLFISLQGCIPSSQNEWLILYSRFPRLGEEFVSAMFLNVL